MSKLQRRPRGGKASAPLGGWAEVIQVEWIPSRPTLIDEHN